MRIIINHSSMIPIYEQIVDQIKKQINNHTLKENDALPSVRSLAKELQISALTVKKAYDFLENEGLTKTIHGKGTFILAVNEETLLEEARKEIEVHLEKAIQKGKQAGVSYEEIKEMLELLMEEYLKRLIMFKNLFTFSFRLFIRNKTESSITGIIGKNGSGKTTTF